MTAGDEAAYGAIVSHHSELNREVDLLAKVVGADAASGANEIRNSGVHALLSYLNSEVVPHAIAEEYTLYSAATELGLENLVEEMKVEHEALLESIDLLTSASTQAEASELSQSLVRRFSAHVERENDEILPVLLASSQIELARVLQEMGLMFEAAKGVDRLASDHDALSSLVLMIVDAADSLSRLGDGGLGARLLATSWAALVSGRADLAQTVANALHAQLSVVTGEPVTLRGRRNSGIDTELDVRVVPLAQRHAKIFSTFIDLRPGEGLALINDHDPRPLRYQFEAEYGGLFTWDYVETGPKVWRVRIGRRA